MRFQRQFRVAAPRDAVAEFHRSGASLDAITPPWVPMRVESAPERLSIGDQMILRLWLGPLPVRWVARIDGMTESGFVDRQVSGPFASWVHRHEFVSHPDDTTEVRDDIEAELGDGFTNRLIGLAMWVGLPVLFAYRRWKTRRLLAHRA